MDKEKLFSIGEVARLFDLSVGTLRHYETLGLVQPEYVDPGTGYRYYSVRQFEPLNTVRYLRMLGMPLPAIGDFLKNRDVGNIEQKLLRQKAEIGKKRRELEIIERKIDNRLSMLADAKSAPLDLIEEKTGVRPEKLWVVSSEYHLCRAGMMTRDCGVEFAGVPASTSRFSQKVNHFLREIAGVWHYLVLGS